jgi:hypothetical protein
LMSWARPFHLSFLFRLAPFPFLAGLASLAQRPTLANVGRH